MQDLASALVIAILLASLIVLLRHLSKKRRQVLDEFEKAFENLDAATIRVRSDDESAATTFWTLEGVCGTFFFSFEAKDRRRDKGNVWYTLSFSRGVPGFFGGYVFGGDSRGAKADQRRLSAFFLRIWPDGYDPPPDHRPERMREFSPRSQ